MDWIVTVPKTTSWEDYQKELAAAGLFTHVLNYRVPFRPKAEPGDRLFVTWNGIVRGWMRITNVIYQPGFTCTTTGKYWKEGYFIQRSGEFHPIKPVPYPGFRGIRKIHLKDVD